MKITLDVPDPKPITGWKIERDYDTTVFCATVMEALTALADDHEVDEFWVDPLGPIGGWLVFKQADERLGESFLGPCYT